LTRQEKLNRLDDIDFTQEQTSKSNLWEGITSRDYLYSILRNKDTVERECKISDLRTKAKMLRSTKEFDDIVKTIKAGIEEQEREEFLRQNPNGLYFDNCPIQLNCSEYRGNESGIYSYKLQIIPQPLVITRIFKDTETHEEKIEIAAKNGKWFYVTVDKEMIANRNKIVSMSNSGILVTSKNADGIVAYLLSLQVENADVIPVVNCVSHLGFVRKRFVPYDADLIYSGDPSYNDIYKSICSHGELAKWVSLYHSVRNDSLAVRAVIASSFVSPLLRILDKLSFFTHISGNSGTGKTVALRFAASVWGNPETYIKNLNSTKVGFERTAYFYHNLPLILDELQTIKNINLAEVIYMLAQGQGKIRGTANGGVDTVLNWRLCNITSGEQPLTRENSNTGEINRIIDIYVKDKVFNDPTRIYNVSSENYGHIGQYFIEHLHEYDVKKIYAVWESFIIQENKDVSGKHTMSIAAIMTADELINLMLFKMNDTDAHNDTLDFCRKLSATVVTTDESDLATRAYDFICGWVAENQRNFSGIETYPQWGYISTGKTTVDISGVILNEVLSKNGFNYKAVLKGLSERNLLINGNDGKNTKPFRLCGVLTRGIEFKINLQV